MRVRRTLIAFAVVFCVAAAVTVLTQSLGGPSPLPPPASAEPLAPAPMRVQFGPTGSASSIRVVPAGTHVIVEVSVTEPAQVSLDGLGQVQPADPDTAASFDLFTDRPLSTAVSVIAANGFEQPIGTLVVTDNR